MLEVILDTETTGLSTKEKHRIVEIGCVELKNQIATNKIFHEYINPQRSISEDAYKVHGYSENFLSNKKTFPEIAENFLNFIKDKKIIIHNASFDLEFLNYELRLINKKEINKRLKKRPNYNLKMFKKLKKLQLPLEVKKKKSNFIIKNNFISSSIKKRVRILKRKILKK